MKQVFVLIAFTVLLHAGTRAQATNTLDALVTQLDKAATIKDYQSLADQFSSYAQAHPQEWLTHYYTAVSNAQIAWLHENDGETIEPFADKAEAAIKQSLALLDTNTQKKELSEVYVVLSMVNRARVFVNPMTYGRKFGPAAGRYIQLALNANPHNARASYLAGWEKYATPKMWGGDKKKAKELLTQAIQQLDAQPAGGNNPRWGRKETDALLNKLK
jgi:hypothetical protein